MTPSPTSFKRWARPSLAALAVLAGAAAAPAQQVDVLIVNGSVYDGTGAAPVRSNIAIADGKIVSVNAPRQQSARLVIDAAGLAVAPGFVDVHNHVPESIDEAPAPFLMPQLITQGVTTVVIGPDGAEGPAGLRKIMGELARKTSGVNYGCYVGHNGVRRDVMGNAQRAATTDELDRMRALVKEGMQMGCVGLSAGLMYEPGMFSPPSEIIALAQEVRPFGGTYDSHSRHPVAQLLSSEAETVDIGAAAGIPAKLGHVKAVGLVNSGRSDEIVALVEAARAKGRAVVSDTYPYDGAATSILRNILVFSAEKTVVPDRVPLTDVKTRLRAALADPEARAALKSATEKGVNGGFSWVKAVGYGSMRIVDAPGQPHLLDKNLELLAKEQGKDPFTLVSDLVLGNEKDITITLGSIEEQDLRNILKQPWTMVASDGAYIGPESRYENADHPRSTGTFTRVLGHYARDVKLFPLEEAIRKMTSLPADHLNLRDRGRIAPGYAADVVIFDPKTVSDRSTYLKPTLLSQGVRHVLVGGEVVLRDGAVTGAAPGRFVPRQARPN